VRTIPREVKDFERIKNLFILSEKQKAVLIGTLLGDGSLKLRGKFHRLHIKHSFKQISLVGYKRKIFSNIVSMPTRVFDQSVCDKSYKFCEFVTLTHPVFSDYFRLFYRRGKKAIPSNISDLFISPISLAVWFMDDGSAEYAGYCLNTQCFTFREIVLLKNMLKKNFSLQTTCRKNKNGWIIYIPKSMVKLFTRLIKRFVIPEFRYKFKVYSKLLTP